MLLLVYQSVPFLCVRLLAAISSAIVLESESCPPPPPRRATLTFAHQLVLLNTSVDFLSKLWANPNVAEHRWVVYWQFCKQVCVQMYLHVTTVVCVRTWIYGLLSSLENLGLNPTPPFCWIDKEKEWVVKVRLHMVSLNTCLEQELPLCPVLWCQFSQK